MKHIKSLDGIRGYAIIAVMIYHFTIGFQQSASLNEWEQGLALLLNVFWMGVDLFFVMSGFLITSLLCRDVNNSHYYQRFYIRRFLRIFPLFYALLFVLTILLPWLSEGFSEKTALFQENSIWFWTYLVNWRIAYVGDFELFQGGYMWSLAVEEQFYLIWPLIIKWGRDRLVQICGGLFAFGLAVKIGMVIYGTTGTALYTSTFTHMDALLLGSVLAVLKGEGDFSTRLVRHLGALALCAIAVLVGLILVEGKLGFEYVSVSAIGLPAIALIGAYILVKGVSVSPEHRLTRVLQNRVVMYFGKLCYGLYLLHQPIGSAVTKFIPFDSIPLWGSVLPSTLLNVIVSVLLSLLVAHLSFHLFEKHFLKLKKYEPQSAPLTLNQSER